MVDSVCEVAVKLEMVLLLIVIPVPLYNCISRIPPNAAVAKVLALFRLEILLLLMVPFTKHTGEVPRRMSHIPNRSHSPLLPAPTVLSAMVLLLISRL